MGLSETGVAETRTEVIELQDEFMKVKNDGMN